MKRNAIGFYWTLPVPRVRFTRLPRNIDEAAQGSRTVAMQRDVIRRWAKNERYDLVHEEVYVELSPDRGRPEIIETLKTLTHFARTQDAEILYVDFGREIGWRSHHFLRGFVGESVSLFREIALSEDEKEDFRAHFTSWRDEQRRWSNSKDERAAVARQRAAELRQSKLSYTSIAARMNDEKILSLTGRAWTGDNVRKLLADKQFPSGDAEKTDA